MVKVGLYKHFKGAYYRVLNISEHTETGQVFVNYIPVKTKGKFKIHARPIEMFTSPVDTLKYPQVTQKNRFEFIK